MAANRKVRRDTRKGPTWAWCLVLFLFIAELLFYTWCRVQCVQVNYDIAEATQDQQRLIALQDNLKIELANLKSPQRIATIAREQLGLITPTSKQMIPIP